MEYLRVSADATDPRRVATGWLSGWSSTRQVCLSEARRLGATIKRWYAVIIRDPDVSSGLPCWRLRFIFLNYSILFGLGKLWTISIDPTMFLNYPSTSNWAILPINFFRQKKKRVLYLKRKFAIHTGVPCPPYLNRQQSAHSKWALSSELSWPD